MGVGSFSGGNDDSFDSDEGEGGVDEGGNESCEVSSLAREPVRLCPCSGVVPVAESSSVVVGSAAESDHEADDDLMHSVMVSFLVQAAELVRIAYTHKTDEAQHFDDRRDELGFSVETDARHVDDENEDERNGDDDGWCDVAPVRDEDSGGRAFRGDGDRVT